MRKSNDITFLPIHIHFSHQKNKYSPVKTLLKETCNQIYIEIYIE